jgi:hypothetical protein
MSIRDARHPERFEAAIMTNRLRAEATDHLLLQAAPWGHGASWRRALGLSGSHARAGRCRPRPFPSIATLGSRGWRRSLSGAGGDDDRRRVGRRSAHRRVRRPLGRRAPTTQAGSPSPGSRRSPTGPLRAARGPQCGVSPRRGSEAPGGGGWPSPVACSSLRGHMPVLELAREGSASSRTSRRYPMRASGC